MNMLVNFIAIFLFVLKVSSLSEFEISVNEVTRELDRFVNTTVGKDYIESYFKSLSLSEPRNVSGTLLLEVARTIELRVNENLQYLKDQLTYFENPRFESRSPQLCCGYTQNLQWVSKYRREVNENDVCDQIGKYNLVCSSNYNNSTELPVQDFYKTVDIKERFKKANTKVYIGTIDGLFTKFPATNNLIDEKGQDKTQCACQSYDPRFRPWYIDTVNLGRGRDIYIMLEFSQRMKNLKEQLLNIVKVLFKILYTKDNIFLRIYKTPVSLCSAETVQATTANLETLLAYIEQTDFTSDVTISFTDVFKDAYERLSENNSREKHFVLLTSGDFQETSTNEVIDNIKPTIDQSNGNVHVKIILLRENKDTDTSEMEKIWTVTKIATSPLKPTVEDMSNVENGDDTRQKIYNLFDATYTVEKPERVHYALPYNDFSGMGEVLDTCIRIFDNQNKLASVLCMSSSLYEFMGDAVSDNLEHHYAFLIDSFESVIFYHPKIKVEDKEISLNILTVETSKGFASILDQVKSGVSENLVGVPVMNVENRTKTYFWKKIPNSNFTLFVVSESEQQSEITFSGMRRSNPGDTFYHRLDAIENITSKKDVLGLCEFNKYILSKNKATYKISSPSFKKKMYHFDETENDVKLINEYFQAYPSDDKTLDQIKTKGILTDLLGSVIASDDIARWWKNDTSQYAPYTIFRYLTFTNGLISSLPGVRLHPYYDPRVRPWFIKCMRIPDRIFITPPYIDVFTGVVTLSMTKAFYKYAGNIKQLSGVWGFDFSLEYFEFLFLKHMDSECASDKSKFSCMVIDNEGNVVYDKLFVDKSKYTHERNIHIIKLEPILGKQLLDDGVMKKTFCIGYNKFKVNQKTRVPFTQFIYSFSHLNETISKKTSNVEYTVMPLQGYMSYVIQYNIKNKDEITNCQCEENKGDTIYPELSNVTCGRRNGVDLNLCECPCYWLQNCNENKPITSHQGAPVDICTPIEFEDERLSFNTQWKVDMFNPPLTKCLDLKCENNTSIECDRPGCDWCQLDCETKTILPGTQRYCTSKGNCCRDVTTTTTTTTQSSSSTKTTTTTTTVTTTTSNGSTDKVSSDNNGLIAVYVVVPIVIVVLAIIIYLYRVDIKRKFSRITSRNKMRNYPEKPKVIYLGDCDEHVQTNRHASIGDGVSA